MNAHYRLVFDHYTLERCGSNVVIQRDGKEWYRYNGETTWEFKEDLPLEKPGFRLPSWEGITLLALDQDRFYEEIGEHTVTESELLGRPTYELVVEPRASVHVDQETGIPLGLRAPGYSLLPLSFELLSGDLDASWTGPIKKISLPAELAERAVDKLPAIESELRVWGNRHEFFGELEEFVVGGVVPMPLYFSEGRGSYPGTEQTWRGWVNIDSAKPDPYWQGLFISRGWTATFATREPRAGDCELTGALSYFDGPDSPLTYVEISAIFGVLAHPDSEEKYFLPLSGVEDFSEIAGWRIEEFIFDCRVVEPPPLSTETATELNYV